MLFDANLLSINAAVTATKNGTGLKIRGTPNDGMAMRFFIPSTTGTTNDLLASVEASHDDSTYTEIARYVKGRQSWASGGKHWIVPFATTRKYVRAVLTLAGSTGTPNFGTVLAGVVTRVMGDWGRDVDFSA